MIAALSQFFVLPSLPDVASRPPKKVRPPLLIADVATPRGSVTEFYHQWRSDEDGPEGPDEALPKK